MNEEAHGHLRIVLAELYGMLQSARGDAPPSWHDYYDRKMAMIEDHLGAQGQKWRAEREQEQAAA